MPGNDRILLAALSGVITVVMSCAAPNAQLASTGRDVQMAAHTCESNLNHIPTERSSLLPPSGRKKIDCQAPLPSVPSQRFQHDQSGRQCEPIPEEKMAHYGQTQKIEKQELHASMKEGGLDSYPATSKSYLKEKEKQEQAEASKKKPLSENTASEAKPSSDQKIKLSLEEIKKAIQKRYMERLEQKESQTIDRIEQKAQKDDAQIIQNPQDQKAPQTDEQREALKRAERMLQYQITGLVIDQTISPFGAHFYYRFNLGWAPPQITRTYNIYILERGNASLGFILTVKVDDFAVWKKRSRPRFQDLEDAAIEAQQQVISFLSHYEEILKQMAGNDMSGDGI